MSEAIELLETLLRKRATSSVQVALDRDAFRAAFSSAGRTFGKANLALGPDEITELRAAGIASSLEGWELCELARVVALVRIAPQCDDFELVADCYARGDNRERSAVLRALPFLPDAARFVPLAVEACRSSVDTIFRAVCNDNAFPAQHFPESNFCQMVIKALFTSTPLARIVGLDARISSELLRMANDYASERRAAGRRVPDDVGWLLGRAAATTKESP